MEAFYILGFLITLTSGVQLPSSEAKDYNEVKHSDIPEPYRQFTYVVLQRSPPSVTFTTQNDETKYNQLYDQGKVSYEQTNLQTQFRKAIDNNEQIVLPYSLPRTKIYNRRIKLAPEQFLKEVTPTTRTRYEEQREEASSIHYTKTANPSLRKEETDTEEQDEEETLDHHIPYVDVTSLESLRPFIYIPTERNPVPQRSIVIHRNINNDIPFLPISTNNYRKTSVENELNLRKQSQRKNSGPQVFEETEKVIHKSLQPQAHLRQSRVFTQVPRLQSPFVNEGFYNTPVPSLSQLQYIIRQPQISYRFKSQDPLHRRQQELQQVSFPSFKQFPIEEETADELDAKAEKHTHASSSAPAKSKSNRRRLQFTSLKTNQEDNEESLGTKLNYHHNAAPSETNYPRWEHRVLPLPNLPYAKQRTVQIIQDEDE